MAVLDALFLAEILRHLQKNCHGLFKTRKKRNRWDLTSESMLTKNMVRGNFYHSTRTF